MKKLVNGELVDLTQEEIDARNAEQSVTETKAITDHIKAYRRERESDQVSIGTGDTLVTVTPDLRTVFTIETIDRDGLGVKDYRADNGVFDLTAQRVSQLNIAIKTHIAKCFKAQATVETAHASTPYTTKDAIETAFDNAYNS